MVVTVVLFLGKMIRFRNFVLRYHATDTLFGTSMIRGPLNTGRESLSLPTTTWDFKNWIVIY